MIDSLHLVGELTGAAAALSALALTSLVRAGPLLLLGFLLLFSAVVDIKMRRLPDWATLAVALLAAGLAATTSLDALLVGLAAALAVFLTLELVRRLFIRRGRPGLGFGDVKLLAALAIWTGLYTPWVVALAAALGLVAAVVRPPRDNAMPFGPFIAVASWIVGLGMEGHLWPAI